MPATPSSPENRTFAKRASRFANARAKDQIALSALSEWFDAGQRVATQGETLAAIYFAPGRRGTGLAGVG